MEPKTILVIGAHMDDCEIGAGGLIVKAVRKGHRVVLVNFCSNYSTWIVTKTAKVNVKEMVMAKASEMRVEKRFLGYGYQAVPENLETIKKLAEIIVEIKPDITFFHNCMENFPADHAIIGRISDYAVRNAGTILGGIQTKHSTEMYSFEVYPKFPFEPDTFIDISDVIEETVNNIDYFGREIYGASHAKRSSEIQSKIKFNCLGEKEISLWHYGEIKLALSLYRGIQSGARFAEAYHAIDKKVIGSRLLPKLIS